MYENIQEELKYYIKQKNTTGAIMLTGSWGSGKTWFIRNKLIKELENDYSVIALTKKYCGNFLRISTKYTKAIKN